MDEVPYLMLELNHFNTLSRGKFSASNFSIFFIFQRFNFFFALLINALLVILPNIDDENTTKSAFKGWRFSEFSGSEKFVWVLGLILLFSYSVTIFLWFHFSYSIKKKSLELEREEKEEK